MILANLSYSDSFAVPTHQHSQQRRRRRRQYASTMPLPTIQMSTIANDENPLVDQLIGHVQNIPQEETNPEEIKHLIAQLSNTTTTSTTTSPNTGIADDDDDDNNLADDGFDALIGYYNVSCTLTARPNDNPVGGKWTRNPKLVQIRRTLQHILPVREHNSLEHAVAQAINVIRLDFLFGLLPIWIVLRGDAVPLEKDTTDDDDDNGDSSKKPLSLLPNLTRRAVRAYFDRPRIAIGNFCFSLGPTSSVVIDTPYVDDRVRIGKGGTSGTQFVFLRVPETDTEATHEWKWLLERTESSFITKRKASWGLATAGILSAIGWRLLTGLSRRVSITSTILSVIALLGVLLVSTGGIETRGGTYVPGK
jgi:hypothetical protein